MREYTSLRKPTAFLSRLRHDRRGAVIIETALITPLLLIMSIGAYDVSRLVARQTELQEVAAEVSAIAMAQVAEDRDLDQLQAIAVAASGVDDDNVSIVENVKCGTDDDLEVAGYECAEGEETSTMLVIEIDATYVPYYSNFGVKHNIELNITRSVQVS
ncbi:MAG: hypothetical protein RLZZ58_1156 [Pseudomonadota bacterium]